MYHTRLLISVFFLAGAVMVSGCDNKSHHGANAWGGEHLQQGYGTEHNDNEHYLDNARPAEEEAMMSDTSKTGEPK